MLPSGAITANDDELSLTAPSPARFVDGTTPRGRRRGRRLVNRSQATSPIRDRNTTAVMKTRLQ